MSSRVGLREVAHAAPGLDLDAARLRELGRRARRHHLAARDHRHPVAHQLDLGQQVRVEQHGDAAVAQRLQQLAHGPPPGRVERAGRLVEQQQPRVADHRLRDPEPLLHALRHRAHAARRDLAEADQLAAARNARRARRASRRASGAGPAPRRRSASPGTGTARRGSRSRRRAATVPLVGRTSPQAIFTSVDFPAPFGPSRPTSSPSPTVRSTPLSASLAPYRFRRSRTVRASGTPLT